MSERDVRFRIDVHPKGKGDEWHKRVAAAESALTAAGYTHLGNGEWSYRPPNPAAIRAAMNRARLCIASGPRWASNRFKRLLRCLFSTGKGGPRYAGRE